jgi:hypothetical protein
MAMDMDMIAISFYRTTQSMSLCGCALRSIDVAILNGVRLHLRFSGLCCLDLNRNLMLTGGYG